MVQLNTSNFTKGEGHSRVPDWLKVREEVSLGFKLFYAEVKRLEGNRGVVHLYQSTLANRLSITTRTVQNYYRQAVDLGLMKITLTGRYAIITLLDHPWMGISETELERFSYRRGNQFGADTKNLQNRIAQPIENKEPSETLETLIENHVEEIRSMHAREVASHSNFTNSVNSEAKETINQVINANTTTSVSSDVNSNTQQILSIYSLEICKQYTLAYAKAKLMTNDEIRDIRAFALYCLRSGEKDAWIAAFIENGYVLTPINPLKDYQVETTRILQLPQQQQQKQATESKEVKGEYPYQVYVDFAKYELKQGKSIESIDNFAGWLHRTGAQDNTQVKHFVDLMKGTYAGGQAPSRETIDNTELNYNNNPININTDANTIVIDDTNIADTIDSNIATTTATTTELPRLVEVVEVVEVADEEKIKSIERYREVLRKAQEMQNQEKENQKKGNYVPSLATLACGALYDRQKEKVIQKLTSEYEEKEPLFCTHLGKERLNKYLKATIKVNLQEMLSRANVKERDVTKYLREIGRSIFEQLEDYEQAELREEHMDETYFTSSAKFQSALLEQYADEIYLELGIGEMGKHY